MIFIAGKKFVDWNIADETNKLSEDIFNYDLGVVTVQKKGLYLIYAQVGLW